MFCSAALTSMVWEGPFGAVKLLDLPSWLTTVERTRAIASPSLLPVGRMMTTAQPSPRPYPSPLLSNVLQRPTGDSACSWQIPDMVSGSSTMKTPQLAADSAS